MVNKCFIMFLPTRLSAESSVALAQAELPLDDVPCWCWRSSSKRLLGDLFLRAIKKNYIKFISVLYNQYYYWKSVLLQVNHELNGGFGVRSRAEKRALRQPAIAPLNIKRFCILCKF